jgi:hypothetical protein
MAAMGNSCFWLVDFLKKYCPLKPLGQKKRNLVGSIYERSSKRIANFVLICWETWSPQTVLVSDWSISNKIFSSEAVCPIRVITKLPNSEQSYKGKVKAHNYTNRQNQSTTGKLWKP